MNRRRFLSLVLALSALVAGAILWQWGTPSPVVAGESWSPETTYIFSDRTDPVWEYCYLVRGNEVVVQKAVFPGYADRSWYRRTVHSEGLMNQMKEWAVRPGNISPPFKPGGPLWSRFSITPDATRERGEAWFSNDNIEVADWLGTLKRECVRNEYRIEKLPAWIADDERVNRYFGF
jgi:hypothetical protein